jgi:hypothetical protein
VSNSQLLVFYSAQLHITIYGNATNWNSAGYWDVNFPQPSKFRVKFWQTVPGYHQDNVKIDDHKSYYKNTRFCGNNETYWYFHCSKKTSLNTFSKKPRNISHTFLFMISLTKATYWSWYSLIDRIGVDFCDGVETLLSSTTINTLYYGVEQIKIWDMYIVYNWQERGWRSVNKCMRVI